jgi:hypothetical protein
MQFAVVLSLLTLLPGHASLTGTWSLDRVRSEFGGADAPTRFVLYLDHAADHITAIMLVTDGQGQRMGYWECRIEDQLNGVLSCVTDDGTTADETWQITAPDELTITRVVNTRSQPVRQKLVLARSKLLK